MKRQCELVDDYLDGELAGESLELFELHLATCASCSEAVSDANWIDDLIASQWTDVSASPALRETIKRMSGENRPGAVDAGRADQRDRRQAFGVIAALVATAAAITALMFVPASTNDPGQDTTAGISNRSRTFLR